MGTQLQSVRDGNRAVSLGVLLVLLRDSLAEYLHRSDPAATITDEMMHWIRVLRGFLGEAVQELVPLAFRPTSEISRLPLSIRTVFLVEQLRGILREEGDTFSLVIGKARYLERALETLERDRKADPTTTGELLGFLCGAVENALR